MNRNPFVHNNSLRLQTVLFAVFCCFGFVSQAQEAKAQIDRDTILIGEEIKYSVEIEVAKYSKVVFPIGQAFYPLEVIDTTAIDTLALKDNYRLRKEFSLTQFDSGAYTIPRQTIIVNGEGVYTPTFDVYVNDVVVDTTQQKLYPIKPALEVRKPVIVATWIWWVLAILLLGFLIYRLILWRLKLREENKELPPFEKAMLSLKELDEAEDLELGRVKDYYTGLSETLKRYVDEKIDAKALESTTGEFIDLLKSFKKEKQIYLKEQVIGSLDAILQRADLAKFAGIRVDKLTAREDRQTIEENITIFDKAIPEPTEEEKLEDERYRAKLEKQQKQRRMWMAGGLSTLILAGLITVFILFNGWEKTRDMVYTPPLKKMMKSEWITSEYGTLGMTVTTPEVLVREMDTVLFVFPGKTSTEEHFSYGDIGKSLHIRVSNMRFREDAQLDSLDLGKMVDRALPQENVANMIVKNQEFITAKNEKGQKLFGSFVYEVPGSSRTARKSYTLLIFNERGGLQQLLITWDELDETGFEIEERVTNSVEFKKDFDA